MDSAAPPPVTAEGFRRMAADGKLALCSCAACGRTSFYPRPRCPHCLSDRTRLLAARGTGTVASFTSVNRAPDAEFSAEAPYTLALIDLEEGVRVVGRILDPLDRVAIGAPVAVTFGERFHGTALPAFRLAP